MTAAEIELLERMHADAITNGDYQAAANFASCLAAITNTAPVAHPARAVCRDETTTKETP